MTTITERARCSECGHLRSDGDNYSCERTDSPIAAATASVLRKCNLFRKKGSAGEEEVQLTRHYDAPATDAAKREGFLDRTLGRILDIKQETQLKAFAIFCFLAIAGALLSPLVRNPVYQLSMQNAWVLSVCLFGIIVIALGDRITSFTISKEKLDVTLNDVKGYMKKRFEEIESETSSSSSSSEESSDISEKLDEAKELLKKKSKTKTADDIVESARDIGNLLGMLEEVEKTRKKVRKQAESESTED